MCSSVFKSLWNLFFFLVSLVRSLLEWIGTRCVCALRVFHTFLWKHSWRLLKLTVSLYGVGCVLFATLHLCVFYGLLPASSLPFSLEEHWVCFLGVLKSFFTAFFLDGVSGWLGLSLALVLVYFLTHTKTVLEILHGVLESIGAFAHGGADVVETPFVYLPRVLSYILER